MRNPSEIRSDIEKLNRELTEVVAHESKRDAAVHILNNLGWAHSPAKGWSRPASQLSKTQAKYTVFDADTMCNLKPGDYVRTGIAGPFYVVRAVSGACLVGQKVISANALGCIVEPVTKELTGWNLTPVSHHDIQKKFAR